MNVDSADDSSQDRYNTCIQDIQTVWAINDETQIYSLATRFVDRKMNYQNNVFEDIERVFFKPFCITIQTDACTMASFIFAGFDLSNNIETSSIYRADNCAACGRCGQQDCVKCQICRDLKRECDCRQKRKYALLTRNLDHQGTYTNITSLCQGEFNHGIIGLQGAYIGDSDPLLYLFGGYSSKSGVNDIYIYNWISNQIIATSAYLHIPNPLLCVRVTQPSSRNKLVTVVIGFVNQSHPNFVYGKSMVVHHVVQFIQESLFYFQCIALHSLNVSLFAVDSIQNEICSEPSNYWICVSNACGHRNIIFAEYCTCCGQNKNVFSA